MIMKYLTLNNGVEMPQLGLGAAGLWYSKKKVLFSKKTWNQFRLYSKTIKMDTFLYDSSGAYGYHQNLLGIINKLYKSRDKMFICTKLGNSEQRTGDVRAALQHSLDALETDYVDLYLMHWPQTDTFIDCYLQMEELYKEGKARAIGVCNFNKHHIEELMEWATVVPAVNQFEIQPLFTQVPLIEYCKSIGIQPMAYSPLGRMHDVLIKAKPLREISKKYGKNIPQIILRWGIQQGLAVLPRTSKPERVEEFLDIFNFGLTDSEMQAISDLNDNIRLRYNPDKCDFMAL